MGISCATVEELIAQCSKTPNYDFAQCPIHLLPATYKPDCFIDYSHARLHPPINVFFRPPTPIPVVRHDIARLDNCFDIGPVILDDTSQGSFAAIQAANSP